jgi:hypothetical protein
MLRIFETQFNEYMTATDNLNREIVLYNLNAELIILNCEFIPNIEIKNGEMFRRYLSYFWR